MAYEDQRNKEEVLREHKTQAFNEKVSQSHDLKDQLQDLAEFLKDFSKSTAVYIGKMVSPKRAIGEEDDDRAHFDEDSQKIIHFLNSTVGHEFIRDKILKPEQGLTFDVFREDEEEGDKQEESNEEEQFDEDGNPIVKPPKEVLE